MDTIPEDGEIEIEPKLQKIHVILNIREPEILLVENPKSLETSALIVDVIKFFFKPQLSYLSYKIIPNMFFFVLFFQSGINFNLVMCGNNMNMSICLSDLELFASYYAIEKRDLLKLQV